jgi:hypothetical protein
MANTIRNKRGTTKPAASDLVTGEIAIKTDDAKLFIENDSGYVFEVGETLGTFSSSTITYTVTVASKTSAHRYNGTGSSNGYKINGIFSPFLSLTAGNTYKFDQSDSSNSGHPLRFYLEADKTTAYTTNVTTNGTAGSSGAYTQIVITDATPIILHYQCSAHAYMGNSVTSNGTSINGNNITSGTIPDARFPATLPASSAANLTSIPAANLTGTLPALNGAALTDLNGDNIGSGTIAAARVATLNQNTTGSAATLTTPRAINGVNFDGSADITVTDSTKLPLTGGTLTGSVTFEDAINETVYSITDGASVDLDPDNGMIQQWTLGANRTATESLTAGQSMMLMVAAGSYTLTFPTITWVGGTAPTLATSGYTVIEIWHTASTLYGATVGDVA